MRRVDHLGALEYLPEGEQEPKDRNTNISRKESRQFLRTPRSRGEDLETVKENNQDKVRKGEPGGVWLKWGGEDQSAAIDTLRRKSLAKADVREADRRPGKELGNRSQVLEPEEDLVGTSANTQVREQ